MYFPHSGQCLGTAIKVVETTNARECLQQCQNVPGCEWFSYLPSDSTCSMTSDCAFVDETCVSGGCVFGFINCHLNTGIPELICEYNDNLYRPLSFCPNIDYDLYVCS